MEALIPSQSQATAPRYSLHDLQAAYESGSFQLVHAGFHSMEQQMLAVRPIPTMVLMCLASPPAGNKSLCSQLGMSSVLCGCTPEFVLQACLGSLGMLSARLPCHLQLHPEVVPRAGHAACACLQGHPASSLRSSEEFPADKENQQVLQQQQQPPAQNQGSRVPGLELLSDEQLAHEAVYALQASGRLVAWDTAGRCVLA